MKITVPDEAWTDVEEGTQGLLDEWLVAPGDRVEKGQVVARIVLVKATHEIEAPADGTIATLDVPAEQNFGRGQALATLRGD
jgi:pyruvate/2-oxoglutarate dehydrogenase complex dihydrolipoamide acyltransferase (E2) component